MRSKGQVWVETVIYTLIGIALIGIVLAIVAPKIGEARDRIVVEQTINSLNALDEKITIALDSGYGNVRIVELSMREGEMYINSTSDKILFVLDGLRKPYSEPGIPIEYGRVSVLSEQNQKSSRVYLGLNYSGLFNLTYAGNEEVKKFTTAAVPYKFVILNKGDVDISDESYLVVVDIRESSTPA